MFVLAACDAPWDGPAAPPNSTSVAYKVVRELGPAAPSDGIVAAQSLAELRSEVLNSPNPPHFEDRCSPSAYDTDPCWSQVADDGHHLFVALPSMAVCYRTVKESAALTGRTLDFIYWIGRPQRACNLALALPHWRLISFPRSELPAPGRLRVDLQVQEADGNSTAFGTEISLI